MNCWCPDVLSRFGTNKPRRLDVMGLSVTCGSARPVSSGRTAMHPFCSLNLTDLAPMQRRLPSVAFCICPHVLGAGFSPLCGRVIAEEMAPGWFVQEPLPGLVLLFQVVLHHRQKVTVNAALVAVSITVTSSAETNQNGRTNPLIEIRHGRWCPTCSWRFRSATAARRFRRCRRR